jgi:hypothetical protein
MEQINLEELAKGISDNLKESETFDVSELESDLNKSLLDLDKEYEKPVTLIKFAREHRKTNDVLTANNISCTIGGAKSKKTFFSSMLLAALMGFKEHGIIGDSLGLDIIFFDTEQAFYHVQKLNRRLKGMVKDIGSLKIYALRPYMPEKRLAMVEYYLEKNKGKYSFVVIDGIVDLLYDFNDLHESKKVATKLMEWSANYSCHINTVLHTNKDQNYARGHLGSELMNKSETVIRLSKESDLVSVVTCEMSRNMGFDEFSFRIDENGLPVRDNLPTGWYDNNPDKLIEPIRNDAGLEVNNEFTESSDVPF